MIQVFGSRSAFATIPVIKKIKEDYEQKKKNHPPSQ
jgi:hypothetical protein